MKFEYGIRHEADDKTNNTEAHRSGMTLAEAQHWIDEWIADGGHPDAFYIVRRQFTSWSMYRPHLIHTDDGYHWILIDEVLDYCVVDGVRYVRVMTRDGVEMTDRLDYFDVVC